MGIQKSHLLIPHMTVILLPPPSINTLYMREMNTIMNTDATLPDIVSLTYHYDSIAEDKEQDMMKNKWHL